MEDFIGVKIALLLGDKLVAIQRDDIPGLLFAGLWDLPGGAREPDETPLECVTREVHEELGIGLDPETVSYSSTHPAMSNPKHTAYFMVAPITQPQVDAIKFGDEGQGWQLMKIDEFLAKEDAIEPLKDRLRDFLRSRQ